MTALGAWIEGIGCLGPGLPDWPAAARVLAGADPWVCAPTVLPAPQGLPAAERRRTGAVVKLALAAGFAAVADAGVDAATLPAVFTSSGGDGQNCDEICRSLAGADRQISPTRFHNSVHNAAAGYWGIASGATPPSNALCAHDASFGAGLLEALAQVLTEHTAVLLVAYDARYPEPLYRERPIPDAFGVALVLTPAPGARARARIEAQLSAAPSDTLPEPRLEALRAAVPAARSLPLLAQLAGATPARVMIDYLDPWRIAVDVQACP